MNNPCLNKRVRSKILKKIVCNSELETQVLGQKIAKFLKAGDLVGLNGDLGAGKTFLCKSMIKSLGVSEDITSPSYTILNDYGNIYHFDVYRLNDLEEMYEIGYEEYFFSDGISFVEWSDEIESLLPEEYFRIEMKLGENIQQRIVTIEGSSQALKERLDLFL
jgi:tRNA threonylcarbamoyladenosine biosynthesis protein TsaE